MSNKDNISTTDETKAFLKPYRESAQLLCDKIDALIKEEQDKLPDGVGLFVDIAMKHPNSVLAKGKYILIGHIVPKGYPKYNPFSKRTVVDPVPHQKQKQL